MQFIVIAHDGKDEGAPQRRAAARPAHLEQAKELQETNKLLHAAAILDGNGQMVGSVMVFDLANRAELDNWLNGEPYVTGKVWDNVEVLPAKVAPAFLPAQK